MRKGIFPKGISLSFYFIDSNSILTEAVFNDCETIKMNNSCEEGLYLGDEGFTACPENEAGCDTHKSLSMKCFERCMKCCKYIVTALLN